MPGIGGRLARRCFGGADMLSLTGVSKAFPGVQALNRVDFAVRAGEIHALVGENGAGKSTLAKIMAGVYSPDDGAIEQDGHPVSWRSPAEAKRGGIEIIHQDLALFSTLSVAENIFIGHERRNAIGALSYRRTEAEARKILARLGVSIDPRARCSELSVADQQMVEIAKAMVHRLRLLILDEPTAVISGREVELLFARLKALRREGAAVVYISHRLDEVFAIADRVTILKDGMLVGTHPTADLDRDRLISMMVGRDLAHLFPPKRPPVEDRRSVLRTQNLVVAERVRGVSIELRAGEILGLAGLIGSGRTELALGIFGALPIAAGSVEIEGTKHRSMTPTRAISLGIGLVTEDRKAQGLALFMDVAANITAATLAGFTRHGIIDRQAERAAAVKAIAEYRIACRGPTTSIATMSGGNQQKVIVARWVRSVRRVLILDEPTRGVDVGAKLEIYRIIQELANTGLGILMISSELPEIVGLADRVIVMRQGVVSGELQGGAISEEAIMKLAAHVASAA
jgi:ABC-type sugar transport system ATPase subunit